MRTWILLSTFALALPLAACGDDTGGAGGGGGSDTTASTGDSGSTGTPSASSGGAGVAPSMTHAACATAAAATIGTEGLAFSPTTATIKAGQSIQFESGTVTHTIKDKAGAWETDDGGTSCLTFSEAGSYPFVCGIHASMSGTITVTE